MVVSYEITKTPFSQTFFFFFFIDHDTFTNVLWVTNVDEML